MTSHPHEPQALARTWAPARGFPGVIAEVNNQILGVRFMVTAFIFFLIAGVMALMMRVQLAVADNDFIGPQVFNELFTMHGSTMMFLFAVPFLEGLALYLLPVMIGARDVAFPRLTAYGYWVYLFGGVLFYASYLFGAVPDVGWFGYTPLSSTRFTGVSTDFWLLGLSMVEVAGLTAAVEIVVTILKFRAPGMTLNRLPLLVLSLLVVGVMILFAFTVLLTATVLLECDRALGTAFFDVERGGSNLLWQHLFWFFGHPEVYIMFLPATGIVSMIVPVFARRPIVGYVLIAAAVIVTGFVSFGLWVHHMFATGLPAFSMAFFTAASLMIAIASGVQVFSWIATLWGSRPMLQAPLWFVLGFLFLFVLGGLTGVMVAVVPFDQQVHDTYFIVAHFHYVLIGGVIFPIFAALYYWLPKMTGRRTHPLLGKLCFWVTFVGFNATFFPMHLMGLLGLPRRVYTYPRDLGLEGYNLVATVGAMLLGCGVLLFLADLIHSLIWGRRAGRNPWGADSLEWSLSSPPPVYSFAELPVVGGRHPLWDGDQASEADGLSGLRQELSGEPSSWRGNLVTDATLANPQAIQYLPGPTYLPFWAAVATAGGAAGILGQSYILAAFSGLMLIVCLIRWVVPRRGLIESLAASDLPRRTGLPIWASGSASVTWWGMVGFLTILATSFAALIYSYFYIRLFSDAWPQGGLAAPNWPVAATGYAAVGLAALAATNSLRRFAAEEVNQARLFSAVTLIFGAVSVVTQLADWNGSKMSPGDHAYASLFFVIGGANMVAVLLGTAGSGLTLLRMWRSPTLPRAHVHSQLELMRLYWQVVAMVAMAVFVTLYLSPHLLDSAPEVR